MAVQDRVEWRRGRRTAPVRWLAWYVVFAGAVVAIVWLLFGSEPTTLDNGSSNPIATLPTATGVIAGAGLIPFVAAIFRRPRVSADHYALTVRPGSVRTLVLPWALIDEVAAYRVQDEQFLLLRCNSIRGVKGDRPRWFDRAVLRTAARATRSAGGGNAIGAYDLAARGTDFRGDVRWMLADLASFAPAHVLIVNEAG
jgi:hypothetical protein